MGLEFSAPAVNKPLRFMSVMGEEFIKINHLRAPSNHAVFIGTVKIYDACNQIAPSLDHRRVDFDAAFAGLASVQDDVEVIAFRPRVTA